MSVKYLPKIQNADMTCGSLNKRMWTYPSFWVFSYVLILPFVYIFTVNITVNDIKLNVVGSKIANPIPSIILKLLWFRHKHKKWYPFTWHLNFLSSYQFKEVYGLKTVQYNGTSLYYIFMTPSKHCYWLQSRFNLLLKHKISWHF